MTRSVHAARARGDRAAESTHVESPSNWLVVTACVLLPMVVFFAINSMLWLRRTLLLIPPPWDQAWFLYMSLRYAHALHDRGPAAVATEFIHASPIYAPLFPLTALPLYLVFGPSRLAAHLTNSFYLFLLLLGVYLLGERLWSRGAGLLAVVFASSFTAIVNYSRD